MPPSPAPSRFAARATAGTIFLIFVLALALRAHGLFRGLEPPGYVFHPDEPKQVLALGNFLEGRYSWHVGSLFYDGYPYGLNHVDEALLRIVRPLRSTAHHGLTAEEYPAGPGLAETFDRAPYREARSLRVFYSLLTLVLFWFTARHLGIPRGARIVGLLWLALSPLAATISHTATGDVGVDLFSALAFFALVQGAATGRETAGLMAASFATGLAFACKYQGALAGFAVVTYVLLAAPRLPGRFFLSLIRRGFLCAGAFVAGAVTLTPMLLFDFNRTLSDILANFRFIQHYNVSASFMALPRWNQIYLSFHNNTGLVLGALGWSLVAAGLAGVAFLLIPPRKDVAANIRVETPRLRMAALSISILPVLVLVVSLAGKPEVQAFHFSWLQVPLALTGLWALHTFILRGKMARAVAVVLALAPVVEWGKTTMGEQYFWGKPDTAGIVRSFHEEIFTPDVLTAGDPGVAKSLFLEKSPVSVFRNRDQELFMPDAGFWGEKSLAPVSPIPWANPAPWVFVNGPAYPRSDRVWWVRGNSRVCRELVFPEKTECLRFGVRSGAAPAKLTLTSSTARKTVVLPPHSAEILELKPSRWMFRQHPVEKRVAFVAPVVAEAITGGATVELLSGALSEAQFLLFSGKASSAEYSAVAASPFVTDPTAAAHLIFCKYWESDSCDAFSRKKTDSIMQWSPDFFVLAAGAYILRPEIMAVNGSATVEIALENNFGKIAVPLGRYECPPGYNAPEIHFSKPFAPYECRLVARVISGEVKIVSWSLRPDFVRLTRDLRAWTQTGAVEDWMKPPPPRKAPAPPPGGSWDDGRILLTSLHVPDCVPAGELLSIGARLQARTFPIHHLPEIYLFLHLLDSSQKQIVAFTTPATPLFGVSFDDENSANFELAGDLPPGRYTVWIGLYNGRTGKRIPLDPHPKVKKNRLCVGEITIGIKK